MFDGIDKHSIVAMSLKGKLKEVNQRKSIKNNIKVVCDILEPKTIVFYNVSTNKVLLDDLLSYPKSKGIEVVLPDNLLLERNLLNKGGKHNGK